MPKVLTPDDITCYIGGLDVSHLLISANASWSSLGENGVLVKTGELEIITPVGSGIDLLTFKVGELVEVRRGGDALPVLSGIYIDSIQENESRTTLSVKTSCKLALNSTARPPAPPICLNPHSTLSANAAITTLLNSVNIENSITGLSGSIRDLNITRYNENIVSTAGEIALAKGFFLFTDHDGIVKAAPYGTYAAGFTTSRVTGLLRYDQSVESGLPPTTFEISTETIEVLDANSDNPQVTRTFADGILTESSTEIGWNGRTITKDESQVQSGVGGLPEDIWGLTFGQVLLNQTLSTESYETIKTNLGDCVVDDPGRLQSRIVTTRSSYGIALEGAIRAAFEAEENLGIPAPEFPVGNVITRGTISEVWSYNYSQPSPIPKRVRANSSGGGVSASGGGSGRESISVVITETATIGEQIPWVGNPTLGRPGESSEVSVSLTQLTVKSKTVTTWTRSTNKRDWSQTTQKFLPQYASNPDGITALRLNPGVPLGNVVSEALRVKLVESSSESSAQPSEPSRFPVRYTLETKPIVYIGEASSASGLQRARGLSVSGNLADNNGTTLLKLAQDFLELQWYRYYSYTVVGDGAELPIDILPMSLVTVEGPEGTLEDVLIADAITVSLRENEITYGFNGLLYRRGFQKVWEQSLTSLDVTSELEYGPFSLLGVVSPGDEYILLV